MSPPARASCLPVTTTLPPPLRGGGIRRTVLTALSTALGITALFFLGTGIDPGLGQSDGVAVGARTALIVTGLVLAAVPYLLFVLPTQRRAERMLAAVLATSTGRPTLPPFEQWGSPRGMFSKVRVLSFTATTIPLGVLLGSAVTFGLFLAEPVAGTVFVALALVPGFFFWVTWTLPSRLQRGVRAGLADGQCVAITLRPAMDQSTLSWFDAVLPDGQHVVLRTPSHFNTRPIARGVLDDPRLVLVIGRGAHQGLLIAPDRPADAVWLRGPVPMVRVPRYVQRGFAAEFKDAGPTTTG
jgi:hypothetical protein